MQANCLAASGLAKGKKAENALKLLSAVAMDPPLIHS
jgi:hypothetical protein